MENEIIKIAKDLLSFKTVTNILEELDELFTYIKNYVPHLNIKEYTYKNKKCLVIANTTDTNLDVTFCTHVDVVPCQTYEITEDEKNLYGRGTIDMKASVAVCLCLMKHLKTNLKVALMITADEEIDGYSASQLLNIYHSKLAIIPDGGSNFDFIKEEKGLFQLKLSLQGISAHASQPFNGQNAIVNLYNIYEELVKKYPLPQDNSQYCTTVNLSMINGGKGYNLVPDYAEMILDIRHTSQDNKKDILQFIKSINPQVEVEVLLKGDVFETDLDNNDIQNYLTICREVLKKEVKIISCESTSDAVYFCAKHIPTIIMNPVGGDPHGPNEYVNKHSLYQLYQIYDLFIKNKENHGFINKNQ